MRLRWTVLVQRGSHATDTVLPGAAARSEVLVECPSGTPLARLPGLDVAGGRSAVSVGGTVLDPHGAVVGRAPLLDGAVVVVAPPGKAARRRDGRGATHLLELVVLAGPDSGTVHPLHRGRLVLGRSGGNDVTVRDPRMSRTHCELVVGPRGVLLTDLGSTNGTVLTGRGAQGHDDVTGPTTGGPDLWQLGQEGLLGASLVALRPVAPAPAAVPTTATDEGTVLVRRSPRLRLPESAPEVRLPAPARRTRAAGFPLIAVLLPALAAGGLALWTGSPVYLLLAALGPLLVAGSWLSTRRDARRDGALGRREHARACTALRRQAERSAESVAQARRAAMPDADTLLRHAGACGRRLWERDPGDDDAFRVRLGRAGAVEGSAGGAMVPRVVLVDPDGRARRVSTPDDLLSVDLRTGALGIVEQGDASAARFVVGQLVALLPPGALDVAAVVGEAAAGRWRWLDLLPHVMGRPVDVERPDPALGARAAARWAAHVVATRGQTGPPAGSARSRPSALLVVVDDPDGELSTDDLAWLPGAAEVGVHVVVVSPGPESLPRGCGTVAVPEAPDGVELTVTQVDGGGVAACVADRVGPWWSERLARHLAPLRAESTEGPSSLPERVRLDALLGTQAATVVARWANAGPGLPAPLGLGREGPVVVDLVRAGPHALVAGTTGSGKSELLRSWLLALALSHPPEDVAFLLVDYKGGATFDALARLPHTVGLLTDLDGATTARVLHSLRAEVRRRERVLAAAGARDLAELRRPPGGTVDLPRLLVVVDEFRVLAEDAPDVLAAFVRLAATGRSLGLHLVLATQRPSGVVSADIRANASLRIALRVQDAAESRDVVDRPDAAWLPHDRPGRAVVVGAGLDETVQTAWVGPDGVEDLRVTVVSPRPAGPFRASSARPGTNRSASTRPDGSAGADDVVDRVVEALALAGRRSAVGPWLPPLPPRLSRQDLAAQVSATAGETPPGRAATAAASAALVLGVTDLPWSQARGLLAWAPVTDGPALVLGGPRSGRSTTLAAMAGAGSELGVAVVRLDLAQDDGDHVVDLLARLADEPALVGRGDAGLRVLLLVDDVDAALDPAVDPETADLLLRVLRTGHRSGTAVALAGGRSTAASRLSAGARVRLVHRSTDPADLVLAGVPTGVRAAAGVPGRCLVVGLASPGAGPVGQDPTVVEAQVVEPQAVAAVGSAPQPPSWLPNPLPRHVPTTRLGAPSRTGLPLGVVSPDGRPWLVRLDSTPLLVVAGPARSGRSSALATLEAQATACGLPLARLPDLDLTPGRDAGAPIPGPVRLLLVDDLERCPEQQLQALEQWLSGASGPLAHHLDPRATVVAAGLSEWFAGTFHGVPAAARRHGCGVVLSAGRTDVRDVLGCRDQVQQRTHLPGRGLLVDRGRAARIQVALPG